MATENTNEEVDASLQAQKKQQEKLAAVEKQIEGKTNVMRLENTERSKKMRRGLIGRQALFSSINE